MTSEYSSKAPLVLNIKLPSYQRGDMRYVLKTKIWRSLIVQANHTDSPPTTQCRRCVRAWECVCAGVRIQPPITPMISDCLL